MTESEWVEPKQAAAMLGNVCVHTLYKWHRLGKGPSRYEFGVRIRYKRADIESWLEAHKRS